MKKSLNICCDGPKIKNIGAYLTILQEILLICKFYKKKNIKFCLNNRVDVIFFFENFLQQLKINVEIVKKNYSKY